MTEWTELSAIRAELDALGSPVAIRTEETAPRDRSNRTTFAQRTPREPDLSQAAVPLPTAQPSIDMRGIVDQVAAQVRYELRAEFTRAHEQLGADLRHEVASQVRSLAVQHWPVISGLGQSSNTEANAGGGSAPPGAIQTTTTLADAIDHRVHAAVEAILASSSNELTAALERRLTVKQAELAEAQLRTMLQEHELAQTRALAGHRSEATHAVARCMSAVDQLRDALRAERGQRYAAQAEAKAAMHAELQPFMQRQQAAMRAEQAARAQSEHRMEQLSAKLSERLQELPSLAIKATRELHIGDAEGDSFNSSATSIGGLLGSLRQRLSDVAAQAAAAVEVASTLAARLPAVEHGAAAAAQSANEVNAKLQNLQVEQRLRALARAQEQMQSALRHVSTALVGQEDPGTGRQSELATLAATVRDGTAMSLNSRLTHVGCVQTDHTATLKRATEKCILHAAKAAQCATSASTFCNKAEEFASTARLSCTKLSEVAAKTMQARQQLEAGMERSIAQLRVMLDEERSHSKEATTATARQAESSALLHRLHNVDNLQTQITQATVEAVPQAQNAQAEASATRAEIDQVVRQRSLAELAIPILRDVAADATAQAAHVSSLHDARSFAIPVLESQIQALEQALKRQAAGQQESLQHNRTPHWVTSTDAWSSDSDTGTRSEDKLSDDDDGEASRSPSSQSQSHFVLALASAPRGQNDGAFV